MTVTIFKRWMNLRILTSSAFGSQSSKLMTSKSVQFGRDKEEKSPPYSECSTNKFQIEKRCSLGWESQGLKICANAATQSSSCKTTLLALSSHSLSLDFAHFTTYFICCSLSMRFESNFRALKTQLTLRHASWPSMQLLLKHCHFRSDLWN